MGFGIGALIGSFLGGRLGDIRPYATTLVAAAATAAILLAVCLASDLMWPTVVLVALLGLTSMTVNPILIALAVRFANQAPTLASALSTSAFNLGTAVDPGSPGVPLTHPFTAWAAHRWHGRRRADANTARGTGIRAPWQPRGEPLGSNPLNKAETLRQQAFRRITVNPIIDVQAARSNRGGRGLMKLASGAAALGIWVAGCASSERNTATTAPAQPVPSLAAGDMSNGADNFYKSDKVTVQKVTFKNQYQMNVAGNLFVPKDLDRSAKHAGDRRRAPDGRGEGAERQPLRHEDGRAGLRRHVHRPVVLGRERGPAAQRGRAGHLCRDFSAAVDFLGTQPFVDRERIGALGICGSGSFVISAAKIDPRMKAIATVSMYDMGAVNRNGLKNR